MLLRYFLYHGKDSNVKGKSKGGAKRHDTLPFTTDHVRKMSELAAQRPRRLQRCKVRARNHGALVSSGSKKKSWSQIPLSTSCVSQGSARATTATHAQTAAAAVYCRQVLDAVPNILLNTLRCTLHLTLKTRAGIQTFVLQGLPTIFAKPSIWCPCKPSSPS